TPPLMLAHPLDDGTAATVAKSVDETAAQLGADRAAYRRLLGGVVNAWPQLEPAILGPLRIPAHPFVLARFGLSAIQPAAQLARSRFSTPAGRALFAGIAAHGMVPLDQRPTAAFGLVLGAAAHVAGW